MGNLSNFIKNSSVSLVYQLINAILNFVTRYYFLKYLGVEILGINSALISVVNTLSLAELGFQTAITFHLYKPLEKDDKEKIKKIMNIFKCVYIFIGIVILLIGSCLIPFLDLLLKGITVNTSVIIYYVLILLSTACSYFFSYQRTLLYADKKDYICKYIDTICLILFSIAKIITLIFTKSFILYLIVTIIQVLLANIILDLFTKKKYPYIRKDKIDFEYLKLILKDVKHILTAKISNYVYVSTPNIIISSFVGAVYVGYYVNYTTIILQLKSLLTMVFNPLLPIIGRINDNENSKSAKLSIFSIVTFLRFLLILLIVMPTFVLIDDFIVIWIGSKFILPFDLVVLLIIDFYISIMYAPCYEFIQVAGLFKQEEKIMLIGTVINLLCSVFLTIKFGMIGVLISAVITQIYFWLCRAKVVFGECFNKKGKEEIYYWLEQLKFCILFIILSFLCFQINTLLFETPSIISFILMGLICEIISIIAVLLFFHKNKSFRYLYSLMLNYWKNKIKKKL